MSEIIKVLDVSGNQVLPITSTSAVMNPSNVGGTLESRLQTDEQAISGKADASNTYTKSEVDAKVSSAYKAAGSAATVSQLGALTAANLGMVYNMTAAFETTADFVEGTTKSYPAGTNVVIVSPSNGVYKYDVLAGFVDLSGKADKSEMSVTDGTGVDADKVTIQLKSGTYATVLKSHQDISGKANKVSNLTSGNFAALDSNGDLTDSGSKAADFSPAVDVEEIGTATLTQQLANNTVYNAGVLTTLTITLPSTITADYISQVNFTSCENDQLTGNSTQFNPPQPPVPTIIMEGDDINAQGQFVPVENRRYTLMLYSDGSNVLGIVRGTDIPQPQS